MATTPIARVNSRRADTAAEPGRAADSRRAVRRPPGPSAARRVPRPLGSRPVVPPLRPSAAPLVAEAASEAQVSSAPVAAPPPGSTPASPQSPPPAERQPAALSRSPSETSWPTWIELHPLASGLIAATLFGLAGWIDSSSIFLLGLPVGMIIAAIGAARNANRTGEPAFGRAVLAALLVFGILMIPVAILFVLVIIIFSSGGFSF